MKKSIKILGILATAIGMGASLISDWADKKRIDEEIEEKINDKIVEWLEKNGEK